MREHPFWWLLTAAALVWYSTITVYVAIRGAADIRTMLRRLREEHRGDAQSFPPAIAGGEDSAHVPERADRG